MKVHSKLIFLSVYIRISLHLTPCNILTSEDDTIHPECIADLEKQIEYIGSPNVVMYYSQEIFHQDKYDDTTITQECFFSNVQIDERKPTWISTEVKRNELLDESQILKLGVPAETFYYDYHITAPQPTSWANWPTEDNKYARYKFTGVEMNFSPDLKTSTR